jgi:hypothetical protein
VSPAPGRPEEKESELPESGTRVVVAPEDGGLADQWGEWIPLEPPASKHLVVDIRRLKLVGPQAAARLRALIDWHVFEDVSVEVLPPADARVRAFYAAMRLNAQLPDTCSCDLGPAPDAGQARC